MAGVARLEFLIVRLILEERRETLDFMVHRDALFQARNQCIDVNAFLLFDTHCGTDCRKEMGIRRVNDIFVGQTQGADKCIF